MQSLVIYKSISLYNIFNELRSNLNFNIIFEDNKNFLNKKKINFENYLIISNKEYLAIDNEIFLDNLPINIFKLLDIINAKFLKLQFNSQSKININNYIINLNSREILLNNIKLKLTEKEINTIINLSKSKKPVSIIELKDKVWQYHNDIETHTVETHIHRLRTKFLNTFDDKEFILTKQNSYQIKKG